MFIDSNKDEIVEGRKLGVELICRVLQVAPRTYFQVGGCARSARSPSDAVLSAELYCVWVAKRKGYGVQKLWKAPLGLEWALAAITQRAP